MTPSTPADRTLASAIGLAFALLLFFGLSACGGGDDDTATHPPRTIATGSSTSVAGDVASGASVLVLPLLGPVVDLPQAALVTVHLQGQSVQTLHYPAQLRASVQLRQPLVGAEADLPTTPHQPASLPVAYRLQLQLPAGRTELQARITTRATDDAGRPNGALARLVAQVDWTVTTTP